MSTGLKQIPLKLSVTELVGFSAREGDLFSEDSMGPDAQEGLRGHQQLQKSRKSPWKAEKHMVVEIEIDDGSVQLGGRVDLINEEETPVIIEEIKTCYGAGHLLPAERKVLHWAQLKVYAALYAFENNIREPTTTICLRLSYYDLLSRQIFQEEELMDVQQAIDYCHKLLRIYLRWWQLLQDKKRQVYRRAQDLEFPYKNYRPQQRELAKTVFRKLRDGESLIFEAPTGTGKTISVLFPALKALGANYFQQILYLTPKGSAQNNALSALAQLKAENQLDCLVLQAKDKACPCLSKDSLVRAGCNSESGVCSRSIGFYDRLPAAREAALQNAWLDQEGLNTLADKFNLCPFAFAIRLVPWFSLVIADVNYFFDPLVRLSCFEQCGKQRVLLMDEVHNLPSRARDMYSAELSSALLVTVLAELPKSFSFLKKTLRRLLGSLRAIEKRYSLEGNSQEQMLPPSISILLQEILKGLQQTGDNGFAGGMPGAETVSYRAWVKQLYRFIAIASLKSDTHRLIFEKEGAESTLKIRCLDASDYLNKLYATVYASIGFSATIRPFKFSLRQLGMEKNTATLNLPSWFPPENQLNLVCNYISTHWQKREENLADLTELIYRFAGMKPGNYLVYFPSYAFLKMTFSYFQQCYPACDVLVQGAEASDHARRDFIEKFTSKKQAVLGFAIVGGVFAEGVDYAGEALMGAMIIGSGMPQPSEEQQLIANLYRKRGLNPYQYAYQFPGFIRLMQTAGRVIRSERDRGVVLFVEPRLARSDYLALLPDYWNMQYCNSLEEVDDKLRLFWKVAGLEC